MAKQTGNGSRRNAPTVEDIVAQQAALGGKMPPQAVDFEEAVLGALMIEHDAFQEVVEILLPEHFYKDQHQRIYSAMMRLNVAQAPIDMLTVANELVGLASLSWLAAICILPS